MDIIIELKGGRVQVVFFEGTPVSVSVHDYDIDGCSPEKLDQDEEGSLYIYYET